MPACTCSSAVTRTDKISRLFVNLVPYPYGAYDPSPPPGTVAPREFGPDAVQPYIALYADALSLERYSIKSHPDNDPSAVTETQVVVPVDTYEMEWTVTRVSITRPTYALGTLPGGYPTPPISITGSKTPLTPLVATAPVPGPNAALPVPKGGAFRTQYVEAKAGAKVQGGGIVVKLDLAELWFDWPLTKPKNLGGVLFGHTVPATYAVVGALPDLTIELDCTVRFSGSANPASPITKHVVLTATGATRAEAPQQFYRVRMTQGPLDPFEPQRFEKGDAREALHGWPGYVHDDCYGCLGWTVRKLRYAAPPNQTGHIGHLAQDHVVMAGEVFPVEVDVTMEIDLYMCNTHKDCKQLATPFAVARMTTPSQYLFVKQGQTQYQQGVKIANTAGDLVDANTWIAWGAVHTRMWRDANAGGFCMLTSEANQKVAILSAGPAQQPTRIGFTGGISMAESMRSTGRGADISTAASFPITITPAKLELALRDLTGKAFAGRAYKLGAPRYGVALSGVVPSDGNLEVVVPPDLAEATLELFSDDDPSSTAPVCRFDITVGDLWTERSNLGFRGRLTNLGLAPGVDAAGTTKGTVAWDREQMIRATERFQTLYMNPKPSPYGLDVNGDQDAKTQAALKAVHDV